MNKAQDKKEEQQEEQPKEEQEDKKKDPKKIRCKKWPMCKDKECPYAHPSEQVT